MEIYQYALIAICMAATLYQVVMLLVAHALIVNRGTLIIKPSWWATMILITGVQALTVNLMLEVILG